MKLSKMFRRAVEIGMEADPRSKKELQKFLKKYQDSWNKLEEKEKPYGDEERTWNPYSDSRILNGTGEEDIKTLMVGIDIETQEVLLADRLRERGEKIDGIFIHHPEGRALADLDKVMGMQVDLIHQVGVPINVLEGQMRPRIERVWRAIHADNLFRAVRAAELLGFPAFGAHTITDNLVWRLMEDTISNKEYDSLDEVLKAIRAIPEYDIYARKGNPPIIVSGSGRNRPGRIAATEFTGGTNGPEELLESQARAGVGTILTMHATEKTLEEARKHHVNMIQCSHMASDSIGVNLLLDKLMKEEKQLKVIEVSGFVRVKRR